MNIAQINRRIEDRVKLYLLMSHLMTDYTEEAQGNVRVSRLLLYECTEKAFRDSGCFINVVTFNRVIDEMKKVGLIGTTHSGGHFIFFTDEGRKLIVEPKWQKGLRKREEMYAEAQDLGLDLEQFTSIEAVSQAIADAKSNNKSEAVKS